jgi:hypothetical protein
LREYQIIKRLRKFVLTVILTVTSVFAFAQSNFYKIAVGGGGGGNIAFADLNKTPFAFGGYAVVDFYATPFITFGLEAQMGLLKGGDIETDPHNRQFTNAYQSFTLGGKFRLGEITDYYYNDFLDLTKGFYLGGGVGVIKNHMNEIVRIKPDGSGYVFPGSNDTKDLIIPVNVGIDFFFNDTWGTPRYILNFNLQHNVTLGEGLDGYEDPQSKFKNNNPDMFTFLSVGFKYNFGPQGLSDKTFR